MRDETFNISSKAMGLASSKQVMEEGIDKYLETGKTDEVYHDLWMSMLQLYGSYDLEKLEIFVPYEDHVTYLMSSGGFEGDYLNKERPYRGDEKNMWIMP